MYTKHNYFNDENPLILGRYFVYQNAPAGGPASGPKQEEAQESAPETEATPEKPITFEEVKKEFDNLKQEYEEKIKKYLPKEHPFHKKMEELGKKIDDAAKSKKDISAETLQAIEDLKKETPEQTAKRIMGVMREMDRRIDFLEARKNVEPEFEDLSKEIKNIQDELAQILKKRLDQTPAGVKKINELMLAYKKAMDRVGVIWNAPPSKPKPKPKGEPKPEEEPKPKEEPKPEEEPKPKGEKKEVAPTGPKEKLVFMLGKVLDEGPTAFDKYSKEIKRLIESLNIQPGPEDKAVIFDDLPGDFKIAHVKWPANAGLRSNFVVFKGDETICYTQDEGNNKTTLVYAEELGPNERPDSIGRRIAEVVKGHAVLPERLSKINFKEGTDRMFFESPSALNDFKSTLLLMAKVTDLKKTSWNGMYEGGKEVHFTRDGNSGEGVYRIILRGDVVLYFDTKKPNQIGVQSKNKEGKKVVNYRDASTFILSPTDQSAYDREKSISSERGDVVDTTKQEQQAPQAEPESPGVQGAPEKAPEVSDVNKFLNEKYESLVAESGSNSITIISKNEDKKGLVNSVRIDELLNLDSFGNQVVTVEIEGPSGKRIGRYWPGEATFFEFKDGNLTNNRIKFYNGDKLSFDFQPLPEEEAQRQKSEEIKKIELAIEDTKAIIGDVEKKIKNGDSLSPTDKAGYDSAKVELPDMIKYLDSLLGNQKNDTEEEKEAKRLEQEADEWQEKAKKLYAKVFDDEAVIGELNTKGEEGQDLTPQEKSKLEKLKSELPAKDKVAFEANQKARELRDQADAIRRGQGKSTTES